MLTVGIQEPSSNTWLVWDNFTLTYKGTSASDISETTEILHTVRSGIYDLQGRRIATAPQKGIYIMNGKKYVR